MLFGLISLTNAAGPVARVGQTLPNDTMPDQHGEVDPGEAIMLNAV